MCCAVQADEEILVDSFRLQGWDCTIVASFEELLSFTHMDLIQFDVILVTNEFNRRCVSDAGQQAASFLFIRLFVAVFFCAVYPCVSVYRLTLLAVLSLFLDACRCSVKGNNPMRNLLRSVFFSFSSLHIPFMVCLVSSMAQEVVMKPCHWKVERPVMDSVIDSIVLESDKYALRKLFSLN